MAAQRANSGSGTRDRKWVRLELREDTFLRELANEGRLPVIDAARFGYPERMRRYKRQPPNEPSTPS